LDSWRRNSEVARNGRNCTYDLDNPRCGTDGCWLALSGFRCGKSTQLVVKVDSVVQEPRGAELLPRENRDLEVGLAVVTEFMVLIRGNRIVSLQHKHVETQPRTVASRTHCVSGLLRLSRDMPQPRAILAAFGPRWMAAPTSSFKRDCSRTVTLWCRNAVAAASPAMPAAG
jgi:hypothetical protein